MTTQKRIGNEFTVAEAVSLKNAINEHFKGFNILINWKSGQIVDARSMSKIGHVGVDFSGRPFASDVTGDSDALIVSLARR